MRGVTPIELDVLLEGEAAPAHQTVIAPSGEYSPAHRAACDKLIAEGRVRREVCLRCEDASHWHLTDAGRQMLAIARAFPEYAITT